MWMAGAPEPSAPRMIGPIAPSSPAAASGELRQPLVRGGDGPGADPRARHDPVLTDAEALGQLGRRHRSRWNLGRDREDRGTRRLKTRGGGLTQRMRDAARVKHWPA